MLVAEVLDVGEDSPPALVGSILLGLASVRADPMRTSQPVPSSRRNVRDWGEALTL
jgi:hypothetical protein